MRSPKAFIREPNNPDNNTQVINVPIFFINTYNTYGWNKLPISILNSQMAAVQATIPFKSRKKTCLSGKTSKREKTNDENIDHLNLTGNKLKRTISKNKSDFEDTDDGKSSLLE